MIFSLEDHDALDALRTSGVADRQVTDILCKVVAYIEHKEDMAEECRRARDEY
jgi:hypothetical protein